MLAIVGAATLLAPVALLVMLAEAGAFTLPTRLTVLVMLAVAGAFTIPAMLAPLVVLASLVDLLALDWMRRRGFRRCQSCWSCQIHGVYGSGSKL